MCFGLSCLFACLLLFPPSLPYFGVSIYTPHTVSLSDVLTGAWEVDCGSVAMVTSLLLRRVLSPPLLPLRHLPSKILAWCFNDPFLRSICHEFSHLLFLICLYNLLALIKGVFLIFSRYAKIDHHSGSAAASKSLQSLVFFLIRPGICRGKKLL